MVVRFENFSHVFSRKGKPVFAPSELGRRIGEDIKNKVEAAYAFEPRYSHLMPGGHVDAMHQHRDSVYFCKVDLERFFYSIGRNRVVRALRTVGVTRPEFYGKWSCVKNPYADPSYSLPYGFVQSPCLATLVLSLSSLGDFLRSLPTGVLATVYVDDICLSSNDLNQLNAAFEALLVAVEHAGFLVSRSKVIAPSKKIEIFNCALELKKSEVTDGRIAEFLAVSRSAASSKAFGDYVASVADGNL